MAEVKTRWKTLRDTYKRKTKDQHPIIVNKPNKEKLKLKQKKETPISKLVMGECKFLSKSVAVDQKEDFICSRYNYTRNLDSIMSKKHTEILQHSNDDRNSLHYATAIKVEPTDVDDELTIKAECETPLIDLTDECSTTNNSDDQVFDYVKKLYNSSMTTEQQRLIENGTSPFPSISSIQSFKDNEASLLAVVVDECNDNNTNDKQVSKKTKIVRNFSASSQHKSVDVNDTPLMFTVIGRELNDENTNENSSSILDQIQNAFYDPSSSSKHQNLQVLANNPEIQERAKEILDHVSMKQAHEHNKITKSNLRKIREYSTITAPKVMKFSPPEGPMLSHRGDYGDETTIVVDCLLEMTASRRAQTLVKLIPIGRSYNTSTDDE